MLAARVKGLATASNTTATGDTARLWQEDGPLRVGVSSCLLGREVRWNGGHKRDRFLTDQLAGYVEWVPVCPEVEAGLGVPRETLRLTREGDDLRLVSERSGRDETARLTAFSRHRVRELEGLDLCGYVLKKDSPSCGFERVRIWNAAGMPERRGRGLFAQALAEASPNLPIEEEGRLNDPRLRENWIERVFAYRRLRVLFAGSWRRGDLVRFHTAHKLQLLAHSPSDYRALGRLVADAKAIGRRELREGYESGFMKALSHMATPRRHVNVLEHALGHLRGRLEPWARTSLREVIHDYGRGLVPLIVPITLLRHHVEGLGVDYLAGQVYLEPHPSELMLRNHV